MIDVRLAHTLTSAQIDELHAFYEDVWWAKGRSRAGIETMLQHCLPFAFLDTDDRLLAFARVVGDGVYKATIFDVIVAPDLRGSGLGKVVMDAVMEHPQVAAVRHVELQCKPELAGFYEEWGFQTVEGIVYARRVSAGSTNDVGG
jgi:GNAT superfamily N-acetyltransferase